MRCSATIDGPDVAAGLAFDGGVLGLGEAARPIPGYAVLEAEGQRIGPIATATGGRATTAAGTDRSDARDWTPVHRDAGVDDLEAAVAAGGRLGGLYEALHAPPGDAPWRSAATRSATASASLAPDPRSWHR